MSPEEVIDILLRQDKAGAASAAEPELPPAQDTPEQARMRTAFFKVIAQAQAAVYDSPIADPEQAEEERLFGEIVTEKYRKQGFNLP